jgi:hypothetical protein
MSGMRGLLVLLGVLAAGAAWADDAPLLLPTRDVAVSYSLIGRGGPKTVVIRQRAHYRVMRIETVGQPGYVLVDRQTQRASMVMEAQGVFADMAANRVPQEGQLPDDKASFKKRGSASLAGIPCTNWDYVTARGNGTVCVTDDGVMLRVEALSGNGLEATNVSFAPQQVAWFTPPAGMKKMGSVQAAARPLAAPTAAAPTSLPSGMNLPPGLKIPPTFKLPPNFKLPPGVQVPAGITLPSPN